MWRVLYTNALPGSCRLDPTVLEREVMFVVVAVYLRNCCFVFHFATTSRRIISLPNCELIFRDDIQRRLRFHEHYKLIVSADKMI